MNKIKISFPDGSNKNYKKGITPKEIVESIGPGLAKAAIAADVNGQLVELTTLINENAKIEIITFDTHKGQDIFHHSTAHIMAQAVKRIFPKAHLTIGPSIEGGFYYDIDVRPLKPEDLEKIEAEMQKIVDEDHELIRKKVTKAQAKKLVKDNPYKIEMIEEFPKGEEITYYQQGEFIDICRGPHVPRTSSIQAFKLTKASSSYWKGDSSKKSLQRIYGVSFPDKKMLRKHLQMIEEAEKRDHRKIGKELDWFSFHKEGAGFPFWHDKGTIIWEEVYDYMKEMLRKKGYQLIKTPIILNKDLWLRSGHWDHYKENMYFTNIDEKEHAVKPMNCPGGLLVYKSNVHSYKELPIKAGEFGLVHRHEMSGVLAGLFRVRCFTQDDAHVFCTEEQLEEEIIKLINLTLEVYQTFGFKEFQIELSTKPEKAMGSEKMWKHAEESLKKSLEKLNIKYKLNPGDGAFYGPKIDFHIKDCMGRSWQCGTIQVDFSMPERFDLTYEGNDGKKHRPVMLHRAVLGSLERFLGILIEHYGGKLPLWLSPEQARIITVADRFVKYAETMAEEMKEQHIRVEVDDRAESIGKKIREAQLSKVNYILVVGEKEEKDKTVNVRTFYNKVLGAKKTSTFIKEIQKEIDEKTLPKE
ncbi:MAG: threonine--tRNA ligase [Nanoarchaeota archaeon]|nr:threonine--tRNA ligase [Nanoarchaeota archaeon]MBU1854272.1 threonine--tRNA ligase [Nanoarchaeota archaeon]